ncbi:ABC transporter substrate-binding protein [Marinobacter sp. SBS5]|uniref:ABC transporter substrate-binding protein n=1 Tax=Marinobacter sp. SBS5 TaxID=3401754 RepID=UPI003AAA8A70
MNGLNRHSLIKAFSIGTLAGALAVATPASALDIRIGYIQFVPDQGPVLSNVIPEPENAGAIGAELAVKDNNTTGKFLGHNYTLETRVVDSEESALLAFTELQNTDIDLFVTRVPRTVLGNISEHADDDTLLFNAGAKDDSLRTHACHANLLHTMPSHAMLADALGQWLRQRRWQEVFLITGPTEGDQAWAAAFRRASLRYGLDIVKDKPWTFDADLRRTASKELPLFTQASDYDAVVVADVRGDFGEYIPFNTWLPRPVVGTQGMMPVAWHRVVESWGAAQLQSRFTELSGRDMTNEDYAAWAAVRAIGTAVTAISSSEVQAIRTLLFSDNFDLAGFKGRKLSFRDWNGQLRQPIPLVHPRGLVAQAPFEGYLHPTSELDTLGYDRPESKCRINN